MKDLTDFGVDDRDNNRHDISSSNNINSAEEDDDNDGGGWDTVQRKKGSGGGSSNRKKNRQQQQQQQQQYYYYPMEGLGGGPTVSLQPPTSIDDIHYYKPFIILLVGLPGSGKSTLAKTLTKLMPWKFIRINQDTLGSRQKCERALIQVLKDNNKNIIRLQNNNKNKDMNKNNMNINNDDESQQSLKQLPLCPIIDRCNFNYQQRLTWYTIAAQHHQYGTTDGDSIPVHVIVLDANVEECIQRCQHRTKHETVSPSQAKAVVKTIAKQFQKPTLNEQKQQTQKRSRSSQQQSSQSRSSPNDEEVVSSSRRRDHRHPATTTTTTSATTTTTKNRKTTNDNNNVVGYTTLQRWCTVDDYNDGLIQLLNQKQ